MMNMYDSNEYYSDGESVVESLNNGHVSPARSMDSWSPLYQGSSWSEVEKDFSGSLIGKPLFYFLILNLKKTRQKNVIIYRN